MTKYIVSVLTICTLILISQDTYAAPSWFENIFGKSKKADDDNNHGNHNDKSHAKEKEHKKYKTKKNKASKKRDKYHKKAHKRKGPPDHAPAHGYRAKFKHYPGSDIYQNTETDTYFRKINGEWSPVDEVPTNIKLGKGVSVDLEESIPEIIRAFQR